MSGHLRQLVETRAARDAARGIFDVRLEQVRRDLDARGVGARVADRLGEDARSALDEAMDVAGESKGIIAGTIAVLALWLMRHPIFAWISGLIQQDTDEQEESNDE